MFNSQFFFTHGFKINSEEKKYDCNHYLRGARKFAYLFLPLGFSFSWCINHSNPHQLSLKKDSRHQRSRGEKQSVTCPTKDQEFLMADWK